MANANTDRVENLIRPIFRLKPPKGHPETFLKRFPELRQMDAENAEIFKQDVDELGRQLSAILSRLQTATPASTTVTVTSTAGPKGDKGDPGEPGADGVAGTAGAAGADGADGAAGTGLGVFDSLCFWNADQLLPFNLTLEGATDPEVTFRFETPGGTPDSPVIWFQMYLYNEENGLFHSVQVIGATDPEVTFSITTPGTSTPTDQPFFAFFYLLNVTTGLYHRCRLVGVTDPEVTISIETPGTSL
jgi:hypothetical protein